MHPSRTLLPLSRPSIQSLYFRSFNSSLPSIPILVSSLLLANHEGIRVASTLPAPPIEYHSALPYAGTSPSPAAEASTSEFILLSNSCSRIGTGTLNDQPMAMPATTSVPASGLCSAFAPTPCGVHGRQRSKEGRKKKNAMTHRPMQRPQSPRPSPAHFPSPCPFD